MVRRYATALAFKTALEQRLQTDAHGSSRELHRLRQLIVFDRFLARLTIAYRDAVVLKGGLVLELRLSRARTTKDIDLRLAGRSDETLTRLQDAGQLDLGDFLTFTVAPLDHLPWPTISAVFGAVQAFLDVVLQGHSGRWDLERWQWVEP